MMTLNSNKQKLYYALLIGEQPKYELDEFGNKIIEYITEDGEIIYRETGETELVYSEPVSFFANISFSSGESQSQEYGVDVSGYDAIIVTNKNELPIAETTLIWFENEIGYKDNLKTQPDENTADYRIVSIKPSLNVVKYVLEKKTK